VPRIPTAIPVVGVILIDREERVLLRRRPPGKRHAGLWEFPGGKVEPGEARKAALVREVAEELGIAVSAGDLNFALRSTDPATDPAAREPHVLFLYTCRVWRGVPRCLEGGAVGWFTPEAARRLPVPPLDVAPVARLEAILAAAA
jgi:8-oxo-dGTP diphosphatase